MSGRRTSDGSGPTRWDARQLGATGAAVILVALLCVFGPLIPQKPPHSRSNHPFRQLRSKFVGLRGSASRKLKCDAAQWPVEKAESAVNAACANVSDRCGPCCRERAARTGARVEQFRRLLLSGAATINISVVGNSVARQNDFATTRDFVQSLEAMAPLTTFDVRHQAVAGGFEPKHLMQCGAAAAELETADVIVVEWSSPAGVHSALDTEFERLIRRFISLPRQPLVIYISHCTMADFSTDPDWAADPGRKSVGEPDGYWETLRVYERKLAAFYGIPFVDTCAAFTSFLRSGEPCDDVHPDLLLNHSTELIPLLLPDYLHQNERLNQLQACLMTAAVIGPPACDPTSQHSLGALPPRAGRSLLEQVGPDGLKFVSFDEVKSSKMPVFCLTARDGTLLVDPAGVASGWQLKQGGAGGQKKWLFTNETKARFATRTPAPATHYTVEVYTHHDLPLGLVRVVVNGTSTIIDPCCPAPQCAGTLKGRGLYKGFRVPEAGELPLAAHPLVIEVLERPRSLPTVCAQKGAAVSVAGVIGFA
eukprot:m.466235 g.466235  ORF g.466235 m.466235 type:complete len:536 (-) comp25043_c0_seq1:91-1698(-)